MDIAHVEAALVRAKGLLAEQDYDLFERLFHTLLFVLKLLRTERSVLAGLRRFFGLKTSEKLRDLLGHKGSKREKSATPKGNASPAPGTTSSEKTATESPADEDGESSEPSSQPDPSKLPDGDGAPDPRKGHGRIPCSSYENAERVVVSHGTLTVGSRCHDCQRGRLYELGQPAKILRIFGQPLLRATCWELSRLRCSGCGNVHTARAPEEAKGPKFDASAVATIVHARYQMGLPHHRLAALQGQMKLPLPASTQWEAIAANEGTFRPVFEELQRQAARGQLLHGDDTYARVLSLMGKRRHALVEAGELEDPKRVGIFTTAIVSLLSDQPIVVFTTGRKYAGENLADLLNLRPANELEPPIYMSDGLDSRNQPSGHTVTASNCLVHARRGFVDELDNFPKECSRVLETFRLLYKVESECKEAGLTDAERLSIHRRDSGPEMEALKTWISQQLDEKCVEPNSGLGRAYRYMLKRWEKLTLFLRKPGAPLDNNLCERILKKAIRHRRASLFYRNERGAAIGDMFMSLLCTTELRGENPIDYLTAVLLNEKAVAASPADWLPWTFRDTLKQANSSRSPPSP